MEPPEKFCSEDDQAVDNNKYMRPASGPMPISPFELTGEDIPVQSSGSTIAAAVTVAFLESGAAYRSMICRNFQMGKCRKGQACRFSHDVTTHVLLPPRSPSVAIARAPIGDTIHSDIISLCCTLSSFTATFKQSYSSLYSYLVPVDLKDLQNRLFPIHDLLHAYFTDNQHAFLRFLVQNCDAFDCLQRFGRQEPMFWKSKLKNIHATVLRYPEVTDISLQDIVLDVAFTPVVSSTELGDRQIFSRMKPTLSPLVICNQTEGKPCLWIALNFTIPTEWTKLIKPGDCYCYRISIAKLELMR